MKIKNKNEQVKDVSLWSEHKPQESLEYQIKTFLDPLLKPFPKIKRHEVKNAKFYNPKKGTKFV
jgi:hypothetical protein